jgi:hypothetical protein
MSTRSRTGKRPSQPRHSAAAASKRGFGREGRDGSVLAGLAGGLVGAVAATGAPAALRLIGRVRLPDWTLPAMVFPSPVPAGPDRVRMGDDAQGGPSASAPPPPGDAPPGPRFAARGPVPQVRPGAVRDYLRARFPMQKAHLTVAALTGVPPGTIRNAMAWNGPSELSGAHMLRLVAVFGPDFLAAVMDPVPGWLAEARARPAPAGR